MLNRFKTDKYPSNIRGKTKTDINPLRLMQMSLTSH